MSIGRIWELIHLARTTFEYYNDKDYLNGLTESELKLELKEDTDKFIPYLLKAEEELEKIGIALDDSFFSKG